MRVCVRASVLLAFCVYFVTVYFFGYYCLPLCIYATHVSIYACRGEANEFWALDAVSFPRVHTQRRVTKGPRLFKKKLMWLSLYVPDRINTIIASHAMPAINAHCHGAISASFRHRRKQNKGKKVCCIGKCYCQLYWKECV